MKRILLITILFLSQVCTSVAQQYVTYYDTGGRDDSIYRLGRFALGVNLVDINGIICRIYDLDGVSIDNGDPIETYDYFRVAVALGWDYNDGGVQKVRVFDDEDIENTNGTIHTASVTYITSHKGQTLDYTEANLNGITVTEDVVDQIQIAARQMVAIREPYHEVFNAPLSYTNLQVDKSVRGITVMVIPEITNRSFGDATGYVDPYDFKHISGADEEVIYFIVEAIDNNAVSYEFDRPRYYSTILAHEYQHLIFKYFDEFTPERWVDEGCSHLAEHVTQEFNELPELSEDVGFEPKKSQRHIASYSTSHSNGLYNTNVEFDDQLFETVHRSGAYLFLLHLYKQHQISPQEYPAIAEINSSIAVGIGNFGSESFINWFQNWVVANIALNNTEGADHEYGYGADPAGHPQGSTDYWDIADFLQLSTFEHNTDQNPVLELNDQPLAAWTVEYIKLEGTSNSFVTLTASSPDSKKLYEVRKTSTSLDVMHLSINTPLSDPPVRNPLVPINSEEEVYLVAIGLGSSTRDDALVDIEIAVDCNGNGVPDYEDITSNPDLDCNVNGRLDDCDIADSLSADANIDGIPDECQFLFHPAENYRINPVSHHPAWEPQGLALADLTSDCYPELVVGTAKMWGSV